jgi:hypothetical protein
MDIGVASKGVKWPKLDVEHPSSSSYRRREQVELSLHGVDRYNFYYIITIHGTGVLVHLLPCVRTT